MCSAVGFVGKGAVLLIFNQCLCLFCQIGDHGLVHVTSSVPSPSGCGSECSGESASGVFQHTSVLSLLLFQDEEIDYLWSFSYITS